MKLWSGNKNSLIAASVLGVIALYMVYSQFFSGPTYKTVTPQTMTAAHSDPSADAAVPAPPPAAGKSSGPNISQAKGKVGKGASSKSKNGEFHPIYIPKKAEDRIGNIGDVDPTIRFDRLERVMNVAQAGSERDLFQILKAPPVKASTLLASANEPKVRPYTFVGPQKPPPPAPPPPPPPPPPPTPIPFKFYGTSAVHPDGTRTAYFIIPGDDGGEILMANEGDVLKKRFRIVQIGVDKCLVEDVTDKRRQPLAMEREATQ